MKEKIKKYRWTIVVSVLVVVLVVILTALSTWVVVSADGATRPEVTPAPVPSTVEPTPEPIAETVEPRAYLEQRDLLVNEWEDAYDLASSTPRFDLVPMIADLQDIKQRTEALELNGKYEGSHDILVGSMEISIMGFDLFMSQLNDDGISDIMIADFIKTGDMLMAEFYEYSELAQNDKNQ